MSLPALNREFVLTRFANNADIISDLHKLYPLAVAQTKPYAAKFDAPTIRGKAEKVWHFMKSQARYKRDPNHKQMIRLPNRFVNDARTDNKSGDCKSFALFSASVLGNLGVPVVKFRYAAYKPGATIPTHVYTVIEDESGKEIIVDGVWNRFDSQKPYTFKKDFKMNTVALAGIGRARKRKKGFFKKFIGLNKKLAMAPSRKMFLLIVRINVRGLATKLAKLAKTNEAKLKKIWVDRLGGNWGVLQKAFNKGKNKKALLGSGKGGMHGIGCAMADEGVGRIRLRKGGKLLMMASNPMYLSHQLKGKALIALCKKRGLVQKISGIDGDEESIGIAPAAALAAATPVIVAFASILKSLKGKGDTEEGGSAAGDVDALVDAGKEAGGSETLPMDTDTGGGSGSDTGMDDSGGEERTASPGDEGKKASDAGGDDDSGGSGETPKWILPAAIAAGAYFLFMK